MKRFLADAVLILILVSIGSYIVQKEDSSTQDSVQKQVEQFEEDVALQKNLKTEKTSAGLNDIEDNRAGKLAQRSSELVVGVIRTTVETFSDIFHGILN